MTYLENPKWKKESSLDFGLPGRFWKSKNGKLVNLES
jgi:hypothetical protein